MMYKLYAPNYSEKDPCLPIIQNLFKEVLGYTEEELKYFTKTHFSCDVVINLTLEQAQEITQIFYNNDIQLYLKDQKTNSVLFWQPDLGIILKKEPPKSHYCDEPLVSRDHLVDAFTQQEKERQENIRQAQQEARNNAIAKTNNTQSNTPKCPTCGSTNVKHISTLNRAVSIGVFGLFSSKIGKNYECLNCKTKW